MRFREVYLVGVDFDYQGGIERHLAPDYHNEKDRIGPTDYDRNLVAQRSAKEYADTHGIFIGNASRKSELTVFKRVEFDSLF